ncbi:hypothetical protein TRAPUB_5210 [Trametes pubescens]|uniref:Uncharacterized protein n=1 Tax=Trametes pubescens TaxID=154538 RepID=A0A1M2V8Z2_TRAPU|nr:hypothetical protein TRAPUB_5210 [Trametes pubescens]
MRILTVELDEFVGDASSRHAPLWTKELAIGKERSLHVVRTYVWLFTFLEHTLSTARQRVSNAQQWDELARLGDDGGEWGYQEAAEEAGKD